MTDANNFNSVNTPNNKPNKTKRNLIIGGVTLGVCALVLGGFLLGKGHSTDQAKTTDSKVENVDNNKDKFTDKDKSKDKGTQTFYDKFMAESTAIPINLATDEDSEIYDSGYKAVLKYVKDDYNLMEGEVTRPDEDSSIHVRENFFVGFAAYQDEDGKWHRIDNIRPIPSLEEKYKDFGGYTTEEAKKEIKEREAKQEKLIKELDEEAASKTEKVDFSGTPEINKLDKGKDAPRFMELFNQLIIDQAEDLANPKKFYTQHDWEQAIPEEGYEALKAVQKGSELNAYDLDGQYYTMISREAVEALNKGYKEHTEELAETWATTMHSIEGDSTKPKSITLDGIEYDLDKFVCELYGYDPFWEQDGNEEGNLDNIKIEELDSAVSIQYGVGTKHETYENRITNNGD